MKHRKCKPILNFIIILNYHKLLVQISGRFGLTHESELNSFQTFQYTDRKKFLNLSNFIFLFQKICFGEGGRGWVTNTRSESQLSVGTRASYTENRFFVKPEQCKENFSRKEIV